MYTQRHPILKSKHATYIRSCVRACVCLLYMRACVRACVRAFVRLASIFIIDV